MTARHRFRSRRLGMAGVFAGVTLLAVSGHAQSSYEVPESENASYDPQALSVLSSRLQEHAGAPDPAPASPADPNSADPGISSTPQARALPTAGGSSVSPQAVALPSGPSSVLGMGESFTPQLSTGIVNLSVPLQLLTARGAVQPKLDLSYSSAAGFGTVGKGWSLGAPAISRQTDRGIPSYDDREQWHPGQDRFVFGGMELVPICNGLFSCNLSGESLPAWADGWQYFRPRAEGGFLRFLWSPNHLTWRIQSKDGATLELGVPQDGSGYRGALETNPEDPSQIFRWYLVRQYDSQSGLGQAGEQQPLNSIVYRYKDDGGVRCLTDIYDTSPAAAPITAPLSQYAHHTRILYESRPDVVRSYRAGWLVEYGLRVSGVDVTSKLFAGGVAAARQLVRRYHFAYEPESHTSLLTSIQMEGRCSTAVAEQSDESLPATQCPRLPASVFEYQRASATSDALKDGGGYAFEPFNEQVRALEDSPPHSLDESMVGLMDLNGDGLPDLVATAPGLYGGDHAVFFNGMTPGGVPGFAGLTHMAVESLDGIDAEALRFDNPNVAPLDLDADGVANLVHMPLEKTYSVFQPVKNGSAWSWRGRRIATASQQNVKIDFTGNARNVRVVDVNADGLVDVVYSSPSELQTFFALGRYPGGDGQFGNARWTSQASAAISNEPVTACAPWSGETLRFSDPDVQIADMNGDGLPDIARVRAGEILYWPGRGNGFWGTGSRLGCPSGQLAQDKFVRMTNAPQFGVVRQGALLIIDVNGDGLSDIVEVHGKGVDIYLNDNGLGWTPRHVIDETPFLPSSSNYFRLTDIDGSGTPDLLWGQGYGYQYIDLTGGVVPHLLVKTRNGLGATTDLEYATTVDVMRQAAAAGKPWATTTPTVSPVLIRSTVRDHLDVAGRPAGTYVNEYEYRDPVYEGRQREFRGFREATVKTLGDGNSPTMLRRTVFQLGECSENFQGSAADVCSPSLRWQDNWRESLKGLPVLNEVFDEAGIYLSTEHTTYELRQLYTGLDGRRVTVPYPVVKDTLLYDVSSFDFAEGSITLDEMRANLAGITHTETRSVVQRATAGTAHTRTRAVYDNFGNVTTAIRDGCIAGCLGGGVDETITARSEFTMGAPSYWSWREISSYVTGSLHTEHRNEVINNYDAQGKLLSTIATLSGSLPLDRFHASGAAIAPAPPNASGGAATPASITLFTHTYDAFGHVVSSTTPNGGCSSATLDSLYAALVTSATVNVGLAASGCGPRALTHAVTYDRGLEVVVDSTSTTGQPSHFSYDGFGRLLSVTSANPATPGQLAPIPSLIVQYVVPDDPTGSPYAITIAKTLDGPDFSTSSYHESWTFTDGLGRTITSLSQANAPAGNWIVGGFTEYNAKGGATRTSDPWYYQGTAQSFSLSATPPTGTICAPRGTPYTEYDSFGRVIRAYGRDTFLKATVVAHAMSQDTYDRADSEAGPHQGTPTTVAVDGHGRQVLRTQRTHGGTGVEDHYQITEYLPTGEVLRVVQRRAGSPDVVRWFRYDSLGRVVLNVEPNTSAGFNPDPNTPATSLKAIRYAYDNAGDMVGFSDARGCGANYFYDTGGRLIAEDRSPCQGPPSYTTPDLSNGNGTEAFYTYDVADPDTATVVDAGGQTFPVPAGLLAGHVASVASLGSKAIFQYDALERMTASAVRIVKPGAPASALASRYAPRWYIRSQTLDALNRPRSATTGLPSNVTQLLGPAGGSQASFGYEKSGRLLSIGGSYGTLLANNTYLADGRTDTTTLGDAASTQRSYCYDVETRVKTVTSYRAAAPIWSSPPAGYTPPAAGDYTAQLLLEDSDFDYDNVGNVIQIKDFRTDSEWPTSAKPVTRTFEYDDLYRLTRTKYDKAAGGTDPWISPYTEENTNASRTPKPSPHVSFIGTARVQDQHYQYDWLGNPQQTTDDQSGFWDRSLGNTVAGTASAGPHQIRSASNRTLAPTSTRKGDLSASYDAAGNVTGLIVRRDGACLPASASCWQRFSYEWSEVGELTRARRWDLATAERTGAANDINAAPPTRTPEVELSYAYDAGGERTLKTSVAQAVTTYTAYIFGSLELRNTTWVTSPAPADYAFDWTKIQLRVPAGPATARIVYSPTNLPTVVSGQQQHVFLELGDHLGSTSFVIDRATGELVEYATYESYGAAESDHRPTRWAAFREPVRFSGKEEDIEVGLSYFGARYYSPQLGVWISPDPVTIHDLGSDLNPYAYVHGSPLMGVDPDGRDPILSGILITAAISAIENIVAQATTVGWNHIDWGFKGVLGAAAAGAVGGGVSAGIGGVLGGSLMQTSGAFEHGLIGLYAGAGGSLASSAFSFAMTGDSSGFGTAALSGGVAGFVGGATGFDAVGLEGNIASSVASNSAGFAVTAAVNGRASVQTLALSLGSGIAGEMLKGGGDSQAGGGKHSAAKSSSKAEGNSGDGGAAEDGFSYMNGPALPRDTSNYRAEADPWDAAGASVMVLLADDVTGVGAVDDVAIPGVIAAAALYDITQRTYVTYTLTNPSTGQVYVGRTSGFGTPDDLARARYQRHYELRAAGFVNPTVDRHLQGPWAYPAIRGREQQLMDSLGGVPSANLANKIRGVSQYNPAGRLYHLAADRFFGNLYRYTGY